jgi:uncharacterized integral membrane protein
MRTAYIILVVFVVVLAAIFAAQNSQIVTVTFFSWSQEGPLSVLLILALAIGLILGLLVMVPSIFRRKLVAHGLKRKVKVLEKEKKKLTAENAAVAAVSTGADTASPVASPTPPSDPAQGQK